MGNSFEEDVLLLDPGGPPGHAKRSYLPRAICTLKEFAHAIMQPLSRVQLLLVGPSPV